MKFLLLSLLVASTNSFAQSVPIKSLVCGSEKSFTQFNVKLDPRGFQSGSGLINPKNANVGYNYSSANLTCIGNTPDNLSCIGYWTAERGDIAEVITSKDIDGAISATFKTSNAYGNKPITVSCVIN